jgi:hypothetical protein
MVKIGKFLGFSKNFQFFQLCDLAIGRSFKKKYFDRLNERLCSGKEYCSGKWVAAELLVQRNSIRPNRDFRIGLGQFLGQFRHHLNSAFRIVFLRKRQKSNELTVEQYVGNVDEVKFKN